MSTPNANDHMVATRLAVVLAEELGGAPSGVKLRTATEAIAAALAAARDVGRREILRTAPTLDRRAEQRAAWDRYAAHALALGPYNPPTQWWEPPARARWAADVADRLLAERLERWPLPDDEETEPKKVGDV